MDILNESKFQGRQQACKERSRKANRYARILLWVTAAVGLFAVYQHRELAPPVHDGMFTVAAVTTDILGGAHETRGAVQNMFGGASASGSQPEFNAITRWLLDNR
ncbi:MAG: hypothetical protein AAF382_00110 [Pseudomonadota bacterium]